MKQDIKLYTQTQIAHKIGISKGTLSKWIIKHNVSPETTKGNKKLYKETLVETYRKSKNDHKASDNKGHRESFSTVEFLKKEVEIKQETIERLQKLIEEKDKTIADFGQKFAKLADQAQQLNLVDKPRLIHKDKDDEENVSNANKETETEKQEEKTKKRHWWHWGKH